MGDKTLNNILGYVNTVYNFLSKNGMIGYPNPLQAVDKIRIHEKELIYLVPIQKQNTENKPAFRFKKYCPFRQVFWLLI